MVLAGRCHDATLDCVDLRQDIGVADCHGSGDDADVRAEAAGDVLELSVRDLNGLNLRSGVHSETSLRMNVLQGSGPCGDNREPRLRARDVQFREPSRDSDSAKDEITGHAEHPIKRHSRQGS